MSEEPNDRQQQFRETLHKASGYFQGAFADLRKRVDKIQSQRGGSYIPDEEELPPTTGRQVSVLEQYREFVAAVRFLTVFPWPENRPNLSASQASSIMPISGAGYFPLIGLFLALLLWLLKLIFSPLLPSLALVAVLVVALIVLTGGLHLDGLMDACDGLFGGATRERKLEIMRDSRVGSFGVLGALCMLLLKFAFLASLDVRWLPLAFLVALPSSRWGMVLAVRIFPGARVRGLGSNFRQTVTNLQLALAIVTSLVVVLVAGHLVGLLVWVGVTLAALAIGAWVTQVLGGLTGDTYGAIAEITEVFAFLLLLLMQLWL
ncbi:adenosylcobinamide-GDP ribazoletransferase [Ktedonosporobacter rubrisoli]|uniref:Adenosylcobinamide-GDP ribazoletransferase n=1 Tax=Ktedonosporobacter rubrisoli TaxID=2509675 RepID=A0A4P6JTE3_KTERU|nr:adenosylcobinamide-GDP ribazoletransferase [Ktedonosporobacter rubrisoli]QBD78849.1 adenosylcobinamide-GDP ribazoletransferase [Ktedonosporobacter rubrisoli]